MSGHVLAVFSGIFASLASIFSKLALTNDVHALDRHIFGVFCTTEDNVDCFPVRLSPFILQIFTYALVIIEYSYAFCIYVCVATSGPRTRTHTLVPCTQCPRVQVFILLRGVMLCLMLGSNGVMLTTFAKAMQRCNSTAEAVSANSAANFILTVSTTAPSSSCLTWNMQETFCIII